MLAEIVRALTAYKDLFRSANPNAWILQLVLVLLVVAVFAYVYVKHLKPKMKEDFYEVKKVRDEYEALCVKEDKTPQSSRTMINQRAKCYDLHSPLLIRPLFRKSS